MEIIIRDRNKTYKQFRHRSGVEEAIRKEWGTQGVSDEKLEKMKWIENKSGLKKSSVKSHVIDEIFKDKK